MAIVNKEIKKLIYRIDIDDEICFYVNGKRWYLGPKYDNNGFENERGWLAYPYNSDANHVVSIDSENANTIMATIINGKTIGDWVSKEGMD